VRRHPDLDWALVRERADALGVGAVLSFTCALLGDVLGVPRTWGHSITPLGPVHTRALHLLFSPRESALADAAARFGFHAALCGRPTLAAKSVTRAVALKVLRTAIAPSSTWR
jgi:hypothetical protein